MSKGKKIVRPGMQDTVRFWKGMLQVLVFPFVFWAFQCGHDNTGPGIITGPADSLRLYKIVPVSFLKPNPSIDLAVPMTCVSRRDTYSEAGEYAMLFINKGNFPLSFVKILGITHWDSTGLAIAQESRRPVYSRTIKLPGGIYTGSGSLPGDTGIAVNFQDSIFSKTAAITIDTVSFDTGSYTLPTAALELTSFADATDIPGYMKLGITARGTSAAVLNGWIHVLFTNESGIPLAWSFALKMYQTDLHFVVPGGIAYRYCRSNPQVPWNRLRVFWEFEDTLIAGVQP